MADDKKTADHTALVEELRAAILKDTSGETQARLLARLDEMEAAPDASALAPHVEALVEEAEEEAATIAPFLSRLSSLLP
jgi:hypothetical protein